MTDEQVQMEPREPGEGDGFFSREAVSGIPWMVFAKGVLFFVYFGVSILTVNGLGKEQFGIYSLLYNISSYLLLLCGLGMGAALMRYVPELAARRNRWGLVHLLWKSAVLQLLALGVLSALLLANAGPLQALFKAAHVEHFRFYLKLICGLTGLLLLKDFVGTVFTTIFKTRTVAVLSVVQGVIWLVLLWVWLDLRPSVGTVFLAQMVAVGVVYGVGIVALCRHVLSLPWHNKERGIGKRRALSFSGTVMLTSVLRMVMFKYSEVFFIAAAGGTTLAGIYDLGYTLPYTVVTFIPLSLVPLFTSAFAEAYVRDRNCLGRLITAYYKLLMVVSLPVAVLGMYFAPAAYRIVYHGDMDEAGRIAAVFCMALVLPLVSMPLSAAIKAREKVLNMVPMLVLQIVVNLFLDWLLIIRLDGGLWGGIGAVVGTFALTIPFRLAVVRGILGGVFFPVGFFLRILAASLVLGGLIRWLAGAVHLFGLSELQVVRLGLLFLVGAVYLGLFMLMVRQCRLIRRSDVADFQALDIESLNRFLHVIVR